MPERGERPVRALGEWVVPADARLPRRHRPWSTVLLVAHSIGVLAGVGLAVYALVVLASALAHADPAGDQESWAMTGAWLVGASAAVVLAVTVPLLWATVVGRRDADDGDRGTLMGAAVGAVCLGGAALAAALLSGDPTAGLVVVLLAGSYVAAAVGVMVVSRPW